MHNKCFKYVLSLNKEVLIMVFEANIPLYIQISNDILSKIEGGEFKNMLPSEMELVNLYNVSRVTIRKALEKLEKSSQEELDLELRSTQIKKS